MKLYLLIGKARSGKDTVTQFIHEYYRKTYPNLKVIDLAFSFYLKEYAKNICNWDGADETKPRDFLQHLGTDIIRKEMDPLFFIHRMLEDLFIYAKFFDVLIISDARFPLEVDFIRKNYPNVNVVFIERPNFETGLTKQQQEHETEIFLENFEAYDFKIINNHDLSFLREKTEQIIEEVEL